MTINLFTRCEGTTLDGTHDFSAGATSLTANGSPSISSTNPKVGSNCIAIPDLGDFYYMASASIAAPAEGCIGFWFRPETWVGGGSLVGVYLSSQTSRHVKVSMLGTDELRLAVRNPDVGPAVNLDTTAANLAVNNYYFVVFRWRDGSNENDRELSVYNASMTELQTVSNLTTAYDHPGSIDRIGFGDFSFSAGGTLRLDNIFVGDSWDDKADILSFANITSWTETSGGESVTGSGAVSAATPTVSGDGIRGVEGAGAVTAGTPTVAGSGTAISAQEGTGALTSAQGTIAGDGIRGLRDLGATSELQVQTPTIASEAVRGIVGAGSCAGQPVQVAGTGFVSDAGVIGSGAITGTIPDVDAVGSRGIPSFGAVNSPSPFVAGVGVVSGAQVGVTGTGALQAPSATCAGVGVRHVVGTGALLAGKGRVRSIVALNGEFPSSGGISCRRLPLRSALKTPLRNPLRAA